MLRPITSSTKKARATYRMYRGRAKSSQFLPTSPPSCLSCHTLHVHFPQSELLLHPRQHLGASSIVQLRVSQVRSVPLLELFFHTLLHLCWPPLPCLADGMQRTDLQWSCCSVEFKTYVLWTETEVYEVLRDGVLVLRVNVRNDLQQGIL